MWLVLGQIYALASMARLVKLLTQLQSLKKEGMSILDYIQKIKRLCNSLATIRELVSRNDKLIYMFNGLDFEYNAFVTSMNDQFDLPSLEEIHSLFFSYEFRLKQQHTVMQANNV